MDIIDKACIEQYCGCKIKWQDLFPYDSFLLGINNQYHTIGDDKYYINSPSINVHDKIVQEGKLYLLLRSQDKSITVIRFLEAYYHNGNVHLIIKDVITNLIFVIRCPIPFAGMECSCKIFDVDCLGETILKNDQLNHRNNADINQDSELFEFDFE